MEDIADYQASIARHLAAKQAAAAAPTLQSLDSRTIHAFCARQAGGKLELMEFPAKPLGPGDVEIKISYCGVCHSDINIWKNDFGTTKFPACLGHEIVGSVTRVGERVRHLSIGQRVGLGWHRSCCGHCEYCTSNRTQLCPDAVNTAGAEPGVGGFSDYIRVEAGAALPIPDEIPSDVAGPLLCGGATVFAPLLSLRVPSTARVGLVGLGGLGHLFVKIAAAWGCEVTVFSHSDKAAEAARLGARKYCRLTAEHPDGLGAFRESLDLLLLTAPADLDWPGLLDCLRPDAALCFLGFTPSPVRLAATPIIMKRLRVLGHPTGSRGDIQKMLEFCARHRIFPEVEPFSVHEAAAALRRLTEGGLRYRAVLRIDDLERAPEPR